MPKLMKELSVTDIHADPNNPFSIEVIKRILLIKFCWPE